MLTLTRARRRTTALATSLLVAGALAVPLAPPAEALTVPEWQTGYVPYGEGCEWAFVSSSAIAFQDSGAPDILGWSINGSTSSAVLVPGTQTVSFVVRAVESCTGVKRVQPLITYRNLRDGTSYLLQDANVPLTTNAFDQRLALRVSVGPDFAGEFRMPSARAERRYDSVSLGVGDYAYLSSSASTSGLQYSSGSWATQRIYLLQKTTITTSASTATVRKGKKVTLRATLKKAGATTYDPAVGSKVALQTRIGTKKWVTRAVVTASSAGAVSYTLTVRKGMSWRWVHTGDRSSMFTAPVTSAAKRITVR